MADLTDDQLQALLDLIDSTGRRIGTDHVCGEGYEEPFCACGRRWSDCDGSRAACHRNQEHVGPFPAEPAPGSAEAVVQAAGTIRSKGVR